MNPDEANLNDNTKHIMFRTTLLNDIESLCKQLIFYNNKKTI